MGLPDSVYANVDVKAFGDTNQSRQIAWILYFNKSFVAGGGGHCQILDNSMYHCNTTNSLKEFIDRQPQAFKPMVGAEPKHAHPNGMCAQR
jgi:hypothetical protein